MKSPTGLSIREKICYGASGASDFLIYTVPSNMMLPVYSIFLKVDPGLLGVVMAFPRLISVLAASLVGGYSDNLRSRHGRRRPLILIGGVAAALLLPLMWFPPQWGASWILAFLLVVLTIYYVAYAYFFVPFQALGLELSDDYNERTRIQAWKGYVSGIGFFMAPWFFWFCSRSYFVDLLAGVRILSLIAGAVIVIGVLITVANCKERIIGQQQERIPAFQALKTSMKNKPFLALQISAFFMILSVCCGGTSGMYLLLYYVCEGDQQFFGLLAGVSGTVANVMTYVAMAAGVWISTRIGKRHTTFWGLGCIALGVALVWFLLQPTHPWLTMIPRVVMGFGLQVCNLMYGSMLADVCDEDELQTGLRREGAYSSAASVFSKSISVVLMVLSGYMPHLVGYLNAAVPPTEPQLLAMKWLLILSQGVFVTVAIVAFLAYPISKKRALETHVELERRHRKRLAVEQSNMESLETVCG